MLDFNVEIKILAQLCLNYIFKSTMAAKNVGMIEQYTIYMRSGKNVFFWIFCFFPPVFSNLDSCFLLFFIFILKSWSSRRERGANCKLSPKERHLSLAYFFLYYTFHSSNPCLRGQRIRRHLGYSKRLITHVFQQTYSGSLYTH